MGLTKLLLETSTSLKSPSVPTPFIDCVFCDSFSEADLVDPLVTGAPLPFGNSSLLSAEIVSGRQLTKGEDVKQTIELTIDVKTTFDYLPGDSVAIFPSNPAEEVETLLGCLGLQDKCDTPVTLSVKEGSKKKLPAYLPTPTTPRTLLLRVLETRGVLKKVFLRSLAECTDDALEKRRLLELSSAEASSDYDKFILNGGVTLTEVLTEFPSCRPPLSLLLEHLPRLTPRAYSIASSPLSHPTRIKIVFNVVHTRHGKVGVCSSWLSKKFEELTDVVVSKLGQLSVSGEDSTGNTSTINIPLFFRKPSKFRVPYDLKIPCIMIGPGTGVAPFIGFLEHMRLSKDKEESGEAVLNRMYFGCRYKDKDHIYKSEIDEFLRAKLLVDCRTCFSRDRLDTEPKYVQDWMRVDQKEIYNLMNNFNAHIFICGDAQNMAKDVLAVLKEIIVESSGVSEEEANEKLKVMESSGQLVKDVWSAQPL